MASGERGVAGSEMREVSLNQEEEEGHGESWTLFFTLA